MRDDVVSIRSILSLFSAADTVDRPAVSDSVVRVSEVTDSVISDSEHNGLNVINNPLKLCLR